MSYKSKIVLCLLGATLLLGGLTSSVWAKPPHQDPSDKEPLDSTLPLFDEKSTDDLAEPGRARELGALQLTTTPLEDKIPVQGTLRDNTGQPLANQTGVTVILGMYDSRANGEAKCEHTTQVDTDANGLFSALIEGCANNSIISEQAIEGQQLYLGITVNGEQMSPRQAIYAVPYAGSLIPGAVIRGNVDRLEGTFYVSSNQAGSIGPSDRRILRGAIAGFHTTNDYYGYGVYGRSQALSGVGVLGLANGPDGFGVWGYATSTTSSTRGVYGRADGETGRTVGVYGQSDSTEGRGVFGYGLAQTGVNYGVRAQTNSPDGLAVYGIATDDNSDSSLVGKSYGVYGVSEWKEGHGVYGTAPITGTMGVATATVGSAYGVYGKANSSEGSGVYGTAPMAGTMGMATAMTGTTYGVHGKADSMSGTGVYGTAPMAGAMGMATAMTGTTYGVHGKANSMAGSGVYGTAPMVGTMGMATAMTGTTYGVHGKADSMSGTGVYGSAPMTGVMGGSMAMTGTTYGVYGESKSSEGRGVFGYATAMTGTTYGVYGKSDATDGAGVRGYHSGNGVGVVAHSEMGNPIEAYGNVPTETVFHVGNTGDVHATGTYHCGGNIVETVTTVTNTVTITGVTRAGLAPCMQDSNTADFAEMLRASTNAPLQPGDVLVIDEQGELTRSTEQYQPTVVGVYSTKPSYLGNSKFAGQQTHVPLALVGIVPVKVSAENGAIQPGDLLVASATPGHAMRADGSTPNGTVIGKALAALEDGTGVIQMLVMLQ